MDEERSFIFYENNYLGATFSAFQDMRKKGEHVDLTIKTKDRQFSVHRVVLAARIPHFSKILTSQHREISLNDIDSDVLDSIINFAYEGRLKVTLQNVHSMLSTAVCLDLCKVQEACLEFHARRFNANKEVKTIKIIPSDVCIRNNFDEFCNSREFLLLPYYSLKELLNRDDVKVPNEEKVFEALMKWIKVSPTERQHHLPYLLPEIRMNHLSSEYLVEKVDAEMVIATSARAKQIVEDAKDHRLLKKRPIFLSFNSNARLYTDIQDRASSYLGRSNITTNQNDLMPCDVSKDTQKNSLATNQSDLTSEAGKFTRSDTKARDQSDFVFSANRNTAAIDVPDTEPNDLTAYDGNNVFSDNILTTNENDVTPSGAKNIPSSSILCTNKSDLRISEASSFSPSDINATGESVLLPGKTSNMTAKNIPATDHNDRTLRSDASNLALSSSVPVDEHDLTLCDTRNVPSSKILAASRSDLVPDHARIFPPKSIVATNRSDSGHSDAGTVPTKNIVTTNQDDSASSNSSKVSPRNIATTSKSDKMASEASQLPMNKRSLLKRLDSNGFKPGIYAIRSFISTGTFVSYYNHTNRKWDDFSFTSRCDRVLHVVSVSEKFYVFFPQSVEAFHLVTHKWYKVEMLSTSTESSGVVSQGNRIYIFGGIQEPDRVRCFDTQDDKWLPNESMRVPCHSMSVVSSPQKFVLLTGGFDVSCINRFSIFHTASKKWTDMPPMITSRMSHDSAIAFRKFFVCGGRNDDVPFLNTMEAYDVVSRQWSFVSQIRISRISHSVVAWKKRLFVFGGKTEEEECCGLVEIYDPATDNWLFSSPVLPFDTSNVPGISNRLRSRETVPVTVKAIVVATTK